MWSARSWTSPRESRLSTARHGSVVYPEQTQMRSRPRVRPSADSRGSWASSDNRLRRPQDLPAHILGQIAHELVAGACHALIREKACQRIRTRVARPDQENVARFGAQFVDRLVQLYHELPFNGHGFPPLALQSGAAQDDRPVCGSTY